MYTEYVASLREDKHQQQRSGLLVCMLCSLVFVTIVLICVTVGLRLSGSRNVLTYQSTVGDTRLIGFDGTFCSGGEMDVGESPSGYVGNMYFLDAEPPLTAINYLVLAGSFYINTGLENYDFYSYETTGIVYVSWQFHLYPGSVIATQSCVSGGVADFIVIQGNSNYNSWLRRLVNSYYAYDAALAPCGSLQNPVFTFSINEEADYYVVYYATSGNPLIRMRLYVNRTEYEPSQPPSCTLNNNGTCTAEAQSSTQYVLLETGRPNNATITYVQSLNLVWRCDAKDGVYAAIFFVPVVVLTLICCGFFVVFCVSGHYRDRH